MNNRAGKVEKRWAMRARDFPVPGCDAHPDRSSQSRHLEVVIQSESDLQPCKLRNLISSMWIQLAVSGSWFLLAKLIRDHCSSHFTYLYMTTLTVTASKLWCIALYPCIRPYVRSNTVHVILACYWRLQKYYLVEIISTALMHQTLMWMLVQPLKETFKRLYRKWVVCMESSLV